MIKLQDFAKECGVTDRQIHRLLGKYEAEVEGHFERQGQNGTWLDEVACQILRSKMKKLPPSVSDQQTVREKQALEAENKRLNEMLGAQGILIGQMHQQISELQDFKLKALEERKALEESKEAQERREKELEQREALFTQELSEAAQKAAEAVRKEEEGKYTQKIAEAAQKAAEAVRKEEEGKYTQKIAEAAQRAQDELAAAQKKAAADLAEKDRRIQELESRTFGDYLKGLFRKKKE